MPEPMRPEDVPAELKKMLDDGAGEDHSTKGRVMRVQAAILTRHEAMVRAKIVAEIRARATAYRDAEKSQTTVGAKWDAFQTATLWDSVADFLECGEAR